MIIEWYYNKDNGHIIRTIFLKKRKGVIRYSYSFYYCNNDLEIISKRKIVIRHTPYRNIEKRVIRWYNKHFNEAKEGDWKD